MTAYVLMTTIGLALLGAAAILGGRPAVIGGAIALGAQVWAVALLRPAMRAPNAAFMSRWLGGMAIRLAALAATLVLSPTLPASIGFLGVLLPLLFLETRFLR